MNARRDMLAVTAGAVAVLHIHRTEHDQSLSQSYPHPEAALLALCAQLEKMRTEWQRLYDATSDEDELTTPADHAWQAYSEDVWPRTALQPKGCTTQDVPALLLTHPAITLEGLRAKAAAILALDEAAGYLMDCRDDSLDLSLSVIRDAAGPPFRSPGKQASSTASRAGRSGGGSRDDRSADRSNTTCSMADRTGDNTVDSSGDSSTERVGLAPSLELPFSPSPKSLSQPTACKPATRLGSASEASSPSLISNNGGDIMPRLSQEASASRTLLRPVAPTT